VTCTSRGLKQHELNTAFGDPRDEPSAAHKPSACFVYSLTYLITFAIVVWLLSDNPPPNVVICFAL